MTENEIRNTTIQPPEVLKIQKLLQKESTIGDLIKLFERTMGIGFWDDAKTEIGHAKRSEKLWQERYEEMRIRALNAEDAAKCYKKHIETIKNIVNEQIEEAQKRCYGMSI